jgi:hypothetical protein
MATSPSPRAAAEPWVQRFELQAAVAAAATTALGAWLAGADGGQADSVSGFTLLAAKWWSALALLVAFAFAFGRARRGERPYSALVAAVLAAASFAYHLWARP